MRQISNEDLAALGAILSELRTAVEELAAIRDRILEDQASSQAQEP